MMPQPFRVLQVFTQMNRGGAEAMIMNIYRNIDRSKIQFDFVVHTKEKCAFDDEITSLGGSIYNIPRYTGKNHFKYKRAWKALLNQHPEYKVIHGHVRSTAAIYLKLAKKRGLTTIAHSHSTSSRGNMIYQNVKNLMQLPIRYTADYLFACSDEAGKWLFGKNVIKRENYRLIKNAIDIEKFAFNESKRNQIRKSLKVENKFVIGHIGSFTHPKNHKFIIDVFLKVQKRIENVVLILVGDGELRESIENKVDKLGLADSVIFTGIRADVPELFQAMDIFLFPSLFEGLPVTLIEAQANSLKCICSETITNEVNITDHIEFISLEKSAEYWAEKILFYVNGCTRNDTCEEINNSGYDVKDSTKCLETFYINFYIQNKK